MTFCLFVLRFICPLLCHVVLSSFNHQFSSAQIRLNCSCIIFTHFHNISMTLYNKEDVRIKASSWMLHVEATFSHVTRTIQVKALNAGRHMVPNPVKLCQSVNFWLFSHCLVLATYRARAAQYPESLRQPMG